MTQHTPGPWELKTQRNCVDEYDCYLYPQRLYIPEDISEADIRLIVQAPNMLKALKLCRFDSLNMSLEDWRFVQSVITAAEGADS